MADTMSNVKLVIYKKIVDGDLRKFSATSNDQPSGGGARDLRFRPAKDFLPVFEKMFPNQDGRILRGCFSWADHDATDVEIHTPTKSRSNEIWIGCINKCFPSNMAPTDAADCILLLIMDDTNKVWPYFTSEQSLRNDNWHPVVKNAILSGLSAKRRKDSTPMGYIDVLNGGTYTNGR